jgi:hypothetical protein
MKIDQPKIKKCPFCLDTAKIYACDHTDEVFIKCNHCSSQTAFVSCKEEAIRLWNKRGGVEYIS